MLPPANFDPLTASSEQLQNYGFPKKPSDPKELAVWEDHMKHAKNFIAPQLIENSNRKHQPPATKTTADTYSPSWSGWFVNPNSGSAFTKIAGDFVVPDVSSSTQTAYECSWVGLGGLNDSRLIQAGTESDVSINWLGQKSTNYYVFTEMLPDQPTEQKVANFPVSPGDQMYVHIEYGTHVDSSGHTIGDATFYIEDMSKNNYTYWVTSALNATTDYYGGVAEWIDERPTVGGSLPSLANFRSDTWTNLYAATPSTSQQLSYWSNTPLNMRNPSNYSDLLAGPGPYVSSSNTFTNYWDHYN
jgi:hypothetical protein